MSIIRIKQLRLENFKSHRHLELNLNGQNATIYGDNATGKTSVYDALTWLLFGKDSLGRYTFVSQLFPPSVETVYAACPVLWSSGGTR